MEDVKSLWNTKVSDLTVGDSLKLSFATPVATVGGMLLMTGVISGVTVAFKKFRAPKATPSPEN